jgi:Cu/Ag efflux protein CusF
VNAALTRCCVVGLVVGLVACNSSTESASKPDYQGTGTIVGLHLPPSALHATRPVVVLRHDPIANLMDETMEHPFIAASATLFAGLKAGDRVTFEMKTTRDALLVVSLKRVRPPRP